MSKNNLAIIGLGSVGQSICHSLLKDGIFETIYLIDKDKNLVDGLYLDFSHAAVNYGTSSVKVGSYDDLKKCSYVIITVGVKQDNHVFSNEKYQAVLDMYDDILDNLKKVNYKDFIIITSNPVDILTFYTYKRLNLPKNKIIGSGTLLDSKRFKFLLGEKLKVSPNALQGFILGQHGINLVPIYSLTRVYSAKLRDYMFNHNISINKEEINDYVKYAGNNIISKSGASMYAIAESVSEIIKSITSNKGAILPLSIISSSDDYAMSLPCIVTSDGIKEFDELYFSNEEIQLIEECKKSSLEMVKIVLKDRLY